MVVKENAMQFEEPKPGSHIAICFGLIDLGTQIHNFQDKTTHSRDLRILFELTGPKMVGKYREENKGKPFVVGVTCKQSLHPKANLRKLLVGWRGRDFTKEELAGFEIDVLVGKPVRLAMVQREERVWVGGDEAQAGERGGQAVAGGRRVRPERVRQPVERDAGEDRTESGVRGARSGRGAGGPRRRFGGRGGDG